MKLILLSLLILLISCNSNDSNYEEQILLCLAEITNPIDNRINCNNEPPEDICTRMNIGIFELTEKSKTQFPDFCLNIDDQITLQDSMGNSLILTVSNKLYEKGNYRWLKDECSNTTQLFEYCITNEIAKIEFESDKADFKIIQQGFFTHDDPNIKGIQMSTQSSIQGIDNTTFLKVIDDYNQYIVPEFEGYQYELSLNLNGQLRNNIHTYYDSTANIDKEIMYFNEDFSLLGFQDSNGTTWIRN